LSPEERTSKLEPLLSNGWSMVDARDAIYKEFLFTNFNQVCLLCVCAHVHVCMHMHVHTGEEGRREGVGLLSILR
jgi:pterin-4a-carbinolamine dehydratase